MRHFTELSTRNFGVDTGFYPLGSCTMKYNPRINERLAALPGFARLHPLQEEDGAQGALELMWRLQEILAEVTGLDAVSLQPAAGSQGELTGLMLVRAYFAARGEDEQRRKVVIPDTAHGTNPASVTMAGYELTHVQTDARGNIDVDDLRGKVDEHTAALMLTNPSTLGLFDENIEEIERIFHGAGALMYYDGANLNAVCGISRPGDMGFDIVHINLHKTFSQPHGGGGPGGGPVAVRDILEPFLPVPAVVRREDGGFGLDFDRPQTIGKVRGFTGPFGVFVRSYAYMRMWGPRLREMSEVAVLNANYVLARLKEAYDLPFDRLCMHEFVLSARTLKQRARLHGARRREAADGLRLPPADDLLPAHRPRGADGRADRDGGEGDARRLLRRDARDRPRGGGGAGAAEGGAAPPAVSGSTRCGRRRPWSSTASGASGCRAQARPVAAELRRAPSRCVAVVGSRRGGSRRPRGLVDSAVTRTASIPPLWLLAGGAAAAAALLVLAPRFRRSALGRSGCRRRARHAALWSGAGADPSRSLATWRSRERAPGRSACSGGESRRFASRSDQVAAPLGAAQPRAARRPLRCPARA